MRMKTIVFGHSKICTLALFVFHIPAPFRFISESLLLLYVKLFFCIWECALSQCAQTSMDQTWFKVYWNNLFHHIVYIWYSFEMLKAQLCILIDCIKFANLLLLFYFLSRCNLPVVWYNIIVEIYLTSVGVLYGFSSEAAFIIIFSPMEILSLEEESLLGVLT